MNPLVGYGLAYAGSKLLDAFSGGDESYRPSAESQAYYKKALQILNNPSGFGMSAAETAQAMEAQQMEAQQAMRQGGADYSTWAARMGIDGGSQAKMRIKLMQEMMRNMMRARNNISTFNAQARTQARLAALGAMGQASGQMEGANLASYQSQMQNQMADEQLLGTLAKYGLNSYFSKGASAPATVQETIGSTYDPAVVTNPRGIY